MPHHDCEAVVLAFTGSTRSSATRASLIGGLRSDSHSQATVPATAMKPKTQASSIAFTVRSRKKPAVPSAAITGSQLSVGSTIR